MQGQGAAGKAHRHVLQPKALGHQVHRRLFIAKQHAVHKENPGSGVG